MTQRDELIEALAEEIFLVDVGFDAATKLYYNKSHYTKIAKAVLKMLSKEIDSLNRYDMITKYAGLLKSRNIVSKKKNGNYLSYHQLKNLLEASGV